MDADERADLFQDLPAERRERIGAALDASEQEDLKLLSGFPEDQVGSVMTSEVATLGPDLSVRRALEELRRQAPDIENIYQVYVVDRGRRLMGEISLRDLLLAEPDQVLREIMGQRPPHIRADAPRAEAAKMVAQYDLLALPVLDGHGRLVGLVTHDDAMDVAEAEATEDFLLAGGFEAPPRGADRPDALGVDLTTAGARLLYRRRIFWLLVLIFGNLFSGAGIAYFEETIAAHVALVFFLPLLIDSGGNAGAQAATLTVRALATGDAVLGDWWRLVRKEVGVALMLGVTMSLAVSLVGLFRGGPEIALVVSLTMAAVVLVGSLVGLSLPFLLSRFGYDPATASAPLVTSVADAAGVVLYFSIATRLLSSPTGA